MTNNRELVQALYDAFARGDAAGMLKAFDPGIVWLEAENGPYADRNPYFGRQQVAEGVLARIRNDWDDFFAYPDTLVQDGSVVVATGRYRGTSRATGRQLNAQFVHVWIVRNGSIVRFQQYADTATFHRVMRPEALGVVHPAFPGLPLGQAPVQPMA